MACHLSHLRFGRPQVLAHGEVLSSAGVPCARAAARVLRKSVRAASSHAAPTQPRSVTVACRSVKPPTAAPSEKPRYMKDALSERTIGASFTPRSEERRVGREGRGRGWG